MFCEHNKKKGFNMSGKLYFGKIFFAKNSKEEYTVGYLFCKNLEDAKIQIATDAATAWMNLKAKPEFQDVIFLKLVLVGKDGDEHQINWKP